VDSWENVPDPVGTINGGFGAEFERFRRSLVDGFLAWQAAIVKEYLRDGQFITHNFDYEWRDMSFGIQPDVNHKEAAKVIDVASCDIYHLSQDRLTGREIAFGGDICRGLKHDNYFVMETQAQGHVNWTPYDGQLRLQAFSHLASGANAVMYWHWHSIHNSAETY
jgi:beta-galactosidase